MQSVFRRFWRKTAAQFGLFVRIAPFHPPPAGTSESFSKMKSNSLWVTSGVKEVLVLQTRSWFKFQIPFSRQSTSWNKNKNKTETIPARLDWATERGLGKTPLAGTKAPLWLSGWHKAVALQNVWATSHFTHSQSSFSDLVLAWSLS